MLDKITNNFGWKLLSLGLAFVLWLIVVNVEDPVVTKTFDNITVNKINESTITDQLKAIEYKEGNTITIVVSGKRSIVDHMSRADVYAYADLSKLSITGAVEIQTQLSKSVEIIKKTPSTMKVGLENIVTVQKEVQQIYKNDPAEGYVALEAEISPNFVQITGPESQIAMIKSVVVPVNIDGAKKDLTLYSNIQIVGENNSQTPKVTANVNQVKVVVPIEKMRKVPLNLTTVGTVPDGYRLTGMTIKPIEVGLQGKESVLNTISQVNLKPIDIAGITASAIVTTTISSVLPEGVSVKSDEDIVEISIEVEPLLEKEVSIEMKDVLTQNLGDTLLVNYETVFPLVLKFRGIQSDLDLLSLELLKPSVALGELLPGDYSIPLDLVMPENIELLSETPMLNLTLATPELVPPVN